MTKPIIALDMDGVIADFDKGVKDFFDIDINGEITPEIKKRLYSSVSKYGDTFWKNLPKMPYADEIFEHVSANHDFFILTAYMTSGKSECIEGKKEWLKNNYGLITTDSNFVCCHSSNKGEYTKYKCDETPHLLIDDRIKNINNFLNNGGLTIHYHHDSHDVAMHKLHTVYS